MEVAQGLTRGWSNLGSLIRSKPDFFIVGGQKCGTTSLYNYLVQHPCVLPASKKEIHFFSDNFAEGYRWYKRHFPPLFDEYRRALSQRHRVVTGEATPYYLFHPHAPRRIRRLFPHAKIIIMLRNPVDRAFSHYRYHVKLGVETLTFEEAIKAEPARLQGELEHMIRDEGYFSFNYKMFSYLNRGIYIDQVSRWFEQFPDGQILVLKSEDFFADPETRFNVVQEFLGLPRHTLSSYRKFNVGEDVAVRTETRGRLQEYFAPHNRRLSAYLGAEFCWDR